jgi:hypothetical protein
LTGDTQKTADVAAKTIDQTVGQGLSQFNAKVQDIADRVPGNIGKKTIGYPWLLVCCLVHYSNLAGSLKCSSTTVSSIK